MKVKKFKINCKNRRRSKSCYLLILQDAIVNISDIANLKKNKIFLNAVK